MAASGRTVHRYSAVPFAEPPLGELRWRPPQPLKCDPSRHVDAAAIPPMCMHTNGDGSEDCLYLNVVVPASANASSKLPVVVYYHGGNLVGGSAPGEVPKAEVLATMAPGGLVVITAAYRLNTLGWLAVDELAAEQGSAGNYGTMDAIAGLQWVQAHVAAFGGDPTRVTLAGQSSGGTLIFSIMAAPTAEGLFTGAISLSGSPNITQNALAKRVQDAPLVAALGCASPPTPQARLACLRALPAANVTAATPPPWGTPGIFGWDEQGLPSPSAHGMAYAGIVHVDGVLLPLPFHRALATGINAKAALIISNMGAEPDRGPGLHVHNDSLAQWNATLLAAVASWPAPAAVAAALSALYAPESRIDVQLAYDSLASDYGLTCAARAIASTLTTSPTTRTAPTYILYSAWLPSTPTPSGAGRWPYHGFDWDSAGWGWSFPPQLSDFQYSVIMQKLFADFAGGSGVLPPVWAWPPSNASATSTMVFAQPGAVWPGGGVRAVPGWRKEQCDGLAGLGFDMQYWWCD